MDPTRFDHFAIAVGQRTTRRTALGLLTALGLTGLVTEEAVAVCLATGERCGDGRGPRCSGMCKGRHKKRCRCPQRVCCQCSDSCGIPSGSQSCQDLCAKRGELNTVINFLQPDKVNVCKDKLCSRASCSS